VDYRSISEVARAKQRRSYLTASWNKILKKHHSLFFLLSCSVSLISSVSKDNKANCFKVPVKWCKLNTSCKGKNKHFQFVSHFRYFKVVRGKISIGGAELHLRFLCAYISVSSQKKTICITFFLWLELWLKVTI
jgi:hypothetical protein